MWATPARSVAGISAAALAEEISARARIASRAPGSSPSESSTSGTIGRPSSDSSARSTTATAAAIESRSVPIPPRGSRSP